MTTTGTARSLPAPEGPWETVARSAEGRGHPIVAAVFRDGRWTGWFTPLALAAPVIALGVGWHAGTSRDLFQQTYSASMGLMVLMACVALAGARLGLLVTLAYAVGDFTAYDHMTNPAIEHPSGLDHITLVVVPILITYLLLAMLLVQTPLVGALAADAVGRRLGAANRHSAVARGVAYIAAVATLTWAWVQAAPLSLRVLWSYEGIASPPVGRLDVAVFDPLQNNGSTLVWAAVGAAAVRAAVELLIARRDLNAVLDRSPDPRVPGPPIPVRSGLLATTLRVLAGAAFVFALISPLARAAGELALLAGSALLAASLRSVVVPRVGPYVRLLARIPIVVRIGLVLGLGRLIMTPFVEEAMDIGNAPSFKPFVHAVAVMLPLGALLLPGASSRGDRVGSAAS